MCCTMAKFQFQHHCKSVSSAAQHLSLQTMVAMDNVVEPLPFGTWVHLTRAPLLPRLGAASNGTCPLDCPGTLLGRCTGQAAPTGCGRANRAKRDSSECVGRAGRKDRGGRLATRLGDDGRSAGRHGAASGTQSRPLGRYGDSRCLI